MTDWAITFEYASRDDPISEAMIAANLRPEREVTQGVLRELETEHRCRTVGQALDLLESSSVEQRRALLDRVREASGLESATRIENRQRFDQVQDDARRRTHGRTAEGAIQQCAAPDCSAVPVHEINGAPRLVQDRRWWCSRHRHLAEPGDDQPPESGHIGPNFQWVPPRSEIERQERERQRLRDEDAERNSRRLAEAKAIREAKERYLAANPPQPPGGGWAPGSKFR